MWAHHPAHFNVMSPHSVIIYDGVCSLCASVVRFVVKRDPAKLFKFASLQSRAAAPLLAAHGISREDALQSFVVLPSGGGAALRRSAAALFIGRHLGGWLWPALSQLARAVPTLVADFFYGIVAANRYAWFGKIADDSLCLLPSRKVLERFLDAEEVMEEVRRKNAQASAADKLD